MAKYSSQVWGALVAHAINSLYDPEDGDGFPCCPHSCAPCGALKILHDDHALDAFVRPYVRMLGGEWDWWDSQANTFRWEWVTERWCNPDTCENNLPAEVISA